MGISESIYEGAVEPSYYNKILGNIPTLMVTSGKREEKTPRHILTPRWVRELASAENDM